VLYFVVASQRGEVESTNQRVLKPSISINGCSMLHAGDHRDFTWSAWRGAKRPHSWIFKLGGRESNY
jgi:hypothetical protein